MLVGLELEAIGKRFADGTRALDNVTLTVEPGEVFALVGPAGSGKTTLLRVIAGLEAPTFGRVRMGGRDRTDSPPHERDVAMVFDRGALWPALTARDNLAFGPRMRAGRLGARGWLKRVLERSRYRDEERRLAARIEAVAGALGIEGLLDRRPRDLSAGERQQVALARALIRPSRVLLLDEPLAHLPPDRRESLRRELAGIFRGLETSIVIHVTHDHDEAWALGRRVGVLVGGALRQVGSPAEVARHPADSEVARFLGPGRSAAASRLAPPG